jgi:hypothetical protein
MSTKTNFKRVALVAVAALGLGVLTSVAPANATDATAANVALTVAAANVDTVGVCAAGTDTTAQVSATPVVMQVGGRHAFTLTTNGDAYLVITGSAKWVTTAAGRTYSADQKTATVTATGAIVAEFTGTGNVQVNLFDYTDGLATASLKTWYFTVVSSCTVGVSAANSYVQVTNASNHVDTLTNWAARQSQLNNNGAADGSATNLNTSNDVRTLFADNTSAYIAVRARDAYTVNISGATNTLIISCDNGAKVGGTGLGFYSTSTFGATTGTSNVAVVQATAGVPMSTTCAVSVNGVALATKKISFAGDLATITIAASRNGNVETATTGRISYVYKDSAGNTLSGATPTMTSGSGGAITNVLTEHVDANYYATGVAYVQAYGAGSNPAYKTGGYTRFNCLDYGNASITAYKYNTAGAKITSNAVDVRCGGAIDTWTASLDKATYKAGDIATLTITAKDAAGGATAYGATPGDGYSVAMPGMTAVVAPATTDTESSARAGVWVYTYTVNSVEGAYNGAVKISVASTSPQYGKAATVSYTIAPNGSVSNADVLKAIVSLIASINKQIAALQKALLKK